MTLSPLQWFFVILLCILTFPVGPLVLLGVMLFNKANATPESEPPK